MVFPNEDEEELQLEELELEEEGEEDEEQEQEQDQEKKKRKKKFAVKKEKLKSKTNVKRSKVLRKNYSLETVQLALKAVEEGNSLRSAAKAYGVPLTSIHRYMQCPERINIKAGHPTVLSESEEQVIVDWAKNKIKNGNPVSRDDLLDYVQTFIKESKIATPFLDGRPSRHWFGGFSRRHPELKLKTRLTSTQETIHTYFTEVQNYLGKKNLIEISPSRVFICDQTSVQLCLKTDDILIDYGNTIADRVIDMNENHTFTALLTVNANGTRAPSMILYPYKSRQIPKKVEDSLPQGWGIDLSENGSASEKTFCKYITKILHPWIVENNIEFPVVIYLNGFQSCMSMPLLEFCQEHRIEFIPLLPDPVNFVQSVDKEFFRLFKSAWNIKVQKWRSENGTRLSREYLAPVLKESLDLMEEKSIIKNRFKRAGLMPFDPEVFDCYTLKKKTLNNKPISIQVIQVNQEDQQHLNFIERNLPDALLQSFQICEESRIWKGDKKMTGLFEFWLKIKTGRSDIF